MREVWKKVRMPENEGTTGMNELIFKSTEKSIPPLRRDIQVIPVQEDGRDLLLFYDPMDLARPGFALDGSVEPVLSLIDGYKTAEQLAAYFENGVTGARLLKLITMMDEQRLLDSPYFLQYRIRKEEDFEGSGIRKPALAGSSYPADVTQLRAFMDETMSLATGCPSEQPPRKALFAPHIDLRVGSRQYADAFSSIKQLTPKRVVILATSHYSGYYPELYSGFPFIGSGKDYELPGRTFTTDTGALKILSEQGEESGFTMKDRAHRVEHSIETHLLFLSHFWKHDFSIVPILVGGIDELFYMPDGELGGKVERFAGDLRKINSDDTFFLISGDLSHVGKKFGDREPAAGLRPEVEEFDRKFVHAAVSGNGKEMLDLLSKDQDPYRICGFPPLYSFLKAFPGLEGNKVNYHWWDESERESAVSFGSIAF